MKTSGAKTERRFRGPLSDEYAVIRKALPHADALQAHLGKTIAQYRSPHGVARLEALEIGCGNGATSLAILNARPDLRLTAVDHEKSMLRQAAAALKVPLAAGRCRLVLGDALKFAQGLKTRSLDLVATALTLHNMKRTYRDRLHRELFRALKPGGLLVNADKFSPQDDAERFEKLGVALAGFFKALAPQGKLTLLEKWVLHNVADQAPDRVMKERDAIRSLRAIGFSRIRIAFRSNMEGVLTARKQLK